ncbi:MAG: Lcl C-terminal domain-containing protein [Acidobacteriaceae bacterium]
MMDKIELAEGETLGGYYSGPDGRLTRFIILLGDNDGDTWKRQMTWALSVGGDLPNRIEHVILQAFHREKFKAAGYWSNQLHDEDERYAWYQGFLSGGQVCDSTDDKLRARAVRREVI